MNNIPMSNKMDNTTLIKNLPKVELHRHLDCSMRFQTMVRIATHLGIQLPSSLSEQKEFFLITDPMDNLGLVLRKFQTAQRLLHSREVLEELAYDVVCEAAHENIKLLELRYSPTFIQEGHPELQWDLIHQAFLTGIERAKKNHDIEVGLLIIIQRTHPLALAHSVCDFALTHKDSIVGLDLADNEEGFDAKPFEPVFLRARKAGLRVTIHAGEIPTPQSIINVEESILRLGAERIGHGIQSHQSEKTLELLVSKNICLEVCPTSNFLTQAISQLHQHPLRALKQRGVKVCINTDDPGIFDYTLEEELRVTQEKLGFSMDEIRSFQQNAFAASFISETKKSRFAPLFSETE